MPSRPANPLPWRAGAFVGAAVALNLAMALTLATGKATAAIPLALVPMALLTFGALISGHSIVLAYVALGLSFTNLNPSAPLPIPGGTKIFATDLILILAISAWTVERLAGRGLRRERRELPLTITWPLLALTVFVALAVVRGNDNYGASLVGQPLRLILYAGIAAALTGATAPALWRGITVVFYAGAVTQFLAALFYLAAGGSQTDSLSLSTGGTRVLSLGTATYLVGSLVCALLNLERAGERFSRQIGHVLVAGLALFGIIVAFGRTTYAAVALIVPLLFLTRKAMRRPVLWLLPLLLPGLLGVILLIPVFEPTLAPTLTSRLEAPPASDYNVRWRAMAREASTEGIDQHLLTGFGFGRPARFVLDGHLSDVTGDPHNSFVYLLAAGGLLAIGSLLAVMLAYLIDVIRRYRSAVDAERQLLVWSVGTWFAFMLNALYGPVLTDATMLMTIWILMIVPWSVPVRARLSVAAGATPARRQRPNHGH